MVQDIGFKHGWNLKIKESYFVFLGDGRPRADTQLHYDGRTNPKMPNGCLRLWILLEDTIDNLCLTLGACPRGVGPLMCAKGDNRVIYYQQKEMYLGDAVLFRGHQVMHFSADLGRGHLTRQRAALVVELEYDYKDWELNARALRNGGKLLAQYVYEVLDGDEEPEDKIVREMLLHKQEFKVLTVCDHIF